MSLNNLNTVKFIIYLFIFLAQEAFWFPLFCSSILYLSYLSRLCCKQEDGVCETKRQVESGGL